MKTHQVEIMSEKEEKLIDVLQHLEFDRCNAKTLVYMLVKKTARGKDIEQAMDIRQPEVSRSTTELRGLGILSMRPIPQKGKGRPTHQYILNKSVSEIKDFLVKGMQEKAEKIEGDLELLNTLISEK